MMQSPKRISKEDQKTCQGSSGKNVPRPAAMSIVTIMNSPMPGPRRPCLSAPLRSLDSCLCSRQSNGCWLELDTVEASVPFVIVCELIDFIFRSLATFGFQSDINRDCCSSYELQMLLDGEAVQLMNFRHCLHARSGPKNFVCRQKKMLFVDALRQWVGMTSEI